MLRRHFHPLLRSFSLHARGFSALVDAQYVLTAKKPLLLLDCNHPAAFPRGHVPSAVPLALAASMLKDATPGATGVVHKDQFKQVLDALSVPKHATIVFYDDQMSLTAVRMWWVFRHFGFPTEQLKVLDGGLKQWQVEGNEVAIGESQNREQYQVWQDVKETQALVGFEQVKQGIADPNTQFVDARSPGEYWGEDANGNKRTGHVPGAVNFNWIEGVDFARNGKFKTKQELDGVFADVFRMDKEKPVITYCQRGIRAAHTAFLLEQVLGFKNVKIYEDSMLQYLNRDDSEVELPE